MCMNAIAECDRGFRGANSVTTIPNWRIVLRNDNGSVVSNVTHNGIDIAHVIYPDTINGSKYTIDNLQSDTLYNITVTSIYNSGLRTLIQSVNTSSSRCQCCYYYNS